VLEHSVLLVSWLLDPSGPLEFFQFKA
jgi:hypothetical protein